MEHRPGEEPGQNALTRETLAGPVLALMVAPLPRLDHQHSRPQPRCDVPSQDGGTEQTHGQEVKDTAHQEEGGHLHTLSDTDRCTLHQSWRLTYFPQSLE